MSQFNPGDLFPKHWAESTTVPMPGGYSKCLRHFDTFSTTACMATAEPNPKGLNHLAHGLREPSRRMLPWVGVVTRRPPSRA